MLGASNDFTISVLVWFDLTLLSFIDCGLVFEPFAVFSAGNRLTGLKLPYLIIAISYYVASIQSDYTFIIYLIQLFHQAHKPITLTYLKNLITVTLWHQNI